MDRARSALRERDRAARGLEGGGGGADGRRRPHRASRRSISRTSCRRPRRRSSSWVPTSSWKSPPSTAIPVGLNDQALRAGPRGAKAVVMAEIPEPGLYTLSFFGTKGGGQSWGADRCRRAVLCPDVESVARWHTILSGEFSSGLHSFTVVLGAGSSVERLKLERKKDSAADYVATLQTVGPRARTRRAGGARAGRRGLALRARETRGGPRAELRRGRALGDPGRELGSRGGRAAGNRASTAPGRPRRWNRPSARRSCLRSRRPAPSCPSSRVLPAARPGPGWPRAP